MVAVDVINYLHSTLEAEAYISLLHNYSPLQSATITPKSGTETFTVKFHVKGNSILVRLILNDREMLELGGLEVSSSRKRTVPLHLFTKDKNFQFFYVITWLTPMSISSLMLTFQFFIVITANPSPSYTRSEKHFQFFIVITFQLL